MMKHYSFKNKRLFLLIVTATLFVIIAGFLKFHSTEKNADYSKLIGRWVRPDGGYILQIRNIQSDSNLEAAYLNPNPINISKANVSFKAGEIEVLVELRDKYYPGSYYTLTYDPKTDRLIGVYHHLGLGQAINVFFLRKSSVI